jgi:hypothetical protein
VVVGRVGSTGIRLVSRGGGGGCGAYKHTSHSFAEQKW